ncbi:hypothetical protein Ahy_A06g030396 [Arachis hypogaea]|uniref:Uncharacterized protein n=1 Tax=Arachis hypogaea TaxID=3818 RepID=A0A445CW35_ARAHY|nr:hypothetical protein Ahy_A06g030396 [Arachis hypogaea]
MAGLIIFGLLVVHQHIFLLCSKVLSKSLQALIQTSPSLQRTCSNGHHFSSLQTVLIVNLVGIVAGVSYAINSGYQSWVYPFLKGLLGRQNRTPTIVIVWPVLLLVG